MKGRLHAWTDWPSWIASMAWLAGLLAACGQVAAPSPEAGVDAGARSEQDSAIDAFVPTCSGICNAATPSYPAVGAEGGQGNVTMYTTEASSGGACNYGATQVMYFAAVNVNVAPGDGLGSWQGGRICGQCAEVTAWTAHGPATVVVRIMDKCPDGYCGMDLGGAAPATLMGDGFGRYDGTWRWISCAGHPEVSDGPTTLAVLSGANPYWSRVQVRNPPSAVSGLDWTDALGAYGSLAWAADPENTFAVPDALLRSAAASLTITARFGDGSVARGTLRPAQLAEGGSSFVLDW